MKRHRATLLWFGLAGMVVLACDRNSDNVPLQQRLRETNVDLKVGDVGESVRTVHEYLTKYGYYPNDDLAGRFPAWRPYIAEQPDNPDVFDQQTADAVRRLQVNYGLLPTGIVDQTTRSAMCAARCGVPDGLAALDSSDKFSFNGSQWSSRTLKYRVVGSPLPSNITLSQAQTAALGAFARWSAETGLTFNMVSSSEDITIKFATIDGPGLILAQTFAPAQGGDMTIDVQETWSTAATTPSNAFDLQSTMLHELGHALGLYHAGLPAAVMYPFGAPGVQHRTPVLDDQVGISALYDTYVQIPGVAQDIGVGDDGSVWVIGTLPASGGYRIHKWNGVDWDTDDNGTSGAVRISVAIDGSPWVVKSTGEVLHKTSNSPFSGIWQTIAGISATDIGVSGGGVWAISNEAVSGGFKIYKLTGPGNQWTVDDNGTSGATRIAVQEGAGGIPWIVTSSGTVLRKKSDVWETLDGNSAQDIGVSPTPAGASVGSFPWAARGVTSSDPLQLTVWDQQPAVAGGSGSDAPAVAQWITVSGSLGMGGNTIAVAVGPGGRPWTVNSAGQIFTSAQ